MIKNNKLQSKNNKKEKIDKIRQKELSKPLEKATNNKTIHKHEKSSEISVIYPVKS